MDRPDDDYTVGFRKPPKHSRFKKGNSGNPGGKRRVVIANANWALADALAKRVTVEGEDGKARISQLEALTRELVKKATAGDLRSLKLVFDRLSRIGKSHEATVQLRGLCEAAAKEDAKAEDANDGSGNTESVEAGRPAEN